jgi:hypothetical protein
MEFSSRQKWRLRYEVLAWWRISRKDKADTDGNVGLGYVILAHEEIPFTGVILLRRHFIKSFSRTDDKSA